MDSSKLQRQGYDSIALFVLTPGSRAGSWQRCLRTEQPGHIPMMPMECVLAEAMV